MRSSFTIALVFTCAAAMTAAAQPSAAELSRANALLRAGEFAQARAAYEELMLEHPEAPVVVYGLAAAQYREAEQQAESAPPELVVPAFEAARDAFKPLQDSTDPVVSQDAVLAYATSQAQLGALMSPEQHQEAVAALREAVGTLEGYLVRHPDDAAAQRNLLRARYLLKQRLQNPPEQPPQDSPPQEGPVWTDVDTELPGMDATGDDEKAIILLKPEESSE